MRVIPLLLLAACGSDFQISTEVQELIVSPVLSDVGLIAVGDTVDLTLTLAAPQGTVDVLALDVLNVNGEGFALLDDTLPSVPGGESVSLTLQYTPTEAGHHWAEITLQTNEGEENLHQVIVRGEADVMAGRLWPSVVDFGPVEAGDTVAEPVTLVNEGRVPLRVSGITFDNGRFALADEVPVEIAVGTEAELTLVATPDDLTEQTGEGEISLGSTVLQVDVRVNACSTASGDLYDSDGDGFGFCASDCDDFDASASPGGVEVCDKVDNDCDGTIDEDTECFDDDGDGFSELDGDCNDGDTDVNPASEELAGNGIDDDCDGITDDGTFDEDGDGYSTLGGDCDDSDSSVYPGGPEQADSVDNDCDGVVDEGTTAYDDDSDTFTEDDGDCDDTDASIWPGATEFADWADNDCDGVVAEGTDNYDDDGDGYTETGGDCDDSDSNVNPGELEVDDDGVDNDCSGTGS